MTPGALISFNPLLLKVRPSEGVHLGDYSLVVSYLLNEAGKHSPVKASLSAHCVASQPAFPASVPVLIMCSVWCFHYLYESDANFTSFMTHSKTAFK